MNPNDEMLDDYSHLTTPIRRNDSRYSREKVLEAPLYVIGSDGVRRRKASLLHLEEEMKQYSTQDFDIIIEALKLVAQERGDESRKSILARCEVELLQLRHSSAP
jgi:hypothetical protein